MAMWKSIVLAAALCGSPFALAQTTAPGSEPPGLGASQLPGATIQKAGEALHDVAQIKGEYSQRMESVQDSGQLQRLTQEEHERQVKAVNARGLSVPQFNQMMQLAQADPGLKQRLLTVAGGQ
jgi:hypothetical protein